MRYPSYCAMHSRVQPCVPTDYSPSASSVRGILQARILEWVAMPSSKGSFQLRDWTQVSHIAGGLILPELAKIKQNKANQKKTKKPTIVWLKHTDSILPAPHVCSPTCPLISGWCSFSLPSEGTRARLVPYCSTLAFVRYENWKNVCCPHRTTLVPRGVVLLLSRYVSYWQNEVTQLCPTFGTPCTVACQAPPFMGFSRQEYWSGLPFPFQGNLSNPGIESRSPTLQADSLLSEPPGKPPSNWQETL